jgi:hypothetical protein
MKKSNLDVRKARFGVCEEDRIVRMHTTKYQANSPLRQSGMGFV